MKWISVEESLPETTFQFEKVIIASDKGVGIADYDEMNGFHGVILSGSTQHSHHKVSHWMPLPQRPRT
ncbi:MAG: DUF551 domain-containing protein [Serratia liquefaciens]|nr:DUF551 domain-containing protein [Serratia liquefaciens]HDS5482422.1 DUF551 domain-containing protein [Serratia liquefaciens]